MKRVDDYQRKRAILEGWPTNPDGSIMPDENGFLPWYGSEDGKGPFEGNPMVDVTCSGGRLYSGPQNSVHWGTQDTTIVRYRLHVAAPAAKVAGQAAKGESMKFDYDRREGLGASDAPAVLGLSPWVTPLQLFKQKTGRSDEQEESLAMAVGLALEPIVLRKFSELTGLTVSHQQARIIDPRLPWRWATLDAKASDGAIVQAKTAAWGHGWGEQMTDEIPDYYIAQTQHEMACTGAMVAWVPVLIAARDFRIYRVERDDELIDMLTEEECKFWLHHVRADIPPPPQPAEASRLWKRDNGKQIVATDEIRAALLKLKGYQIDLDWNAEQVEAIKNEIKLYMQDAAELVDSTGKTLCTWKAAKASSKTDWKALVESLHLTPEIVAEFTKTVDGSRRFLLKDRQ